MRGGSPFGSVLTVVKFAHQYLVRSLRLYLQLDSAIAIS